MRLLLDLTDEEILAVDGADQGLVTLPYVDRIGAEAREIARSTALRCLFARGLLRFSAQHCDAAGRPPGPGERAVDVDPALASILADRRTPEAVLAAQRITAGAAGPEALMRYVYRSGERVLIEDVSASGIHRFAGADLLGLPALMQEFLQATDHGHDRSTAGDPSDPSGRGDWPEEVVPCRDGAGLLAGVYLVAELIVRRDEVPATFSHTAYVYPHVAYVGRAPLEDPSAARLIRSDPAGLGRWAAGLLR